MIRIAGWWFRICRMLIITGLMVVTVTPVWAYEPVTALDDAFAVPRHGRLAESVADYPGVESLVGHSYAVLAWQRPFGIDELAVSTLHAGAVFGPVGISGAFSSSGFDLYGEELSKLGVSCMVRPGLSAGVRLVRPAMRIRGFGRADTFTADAGIVWCPSTPVSVAFAIENIAGSTLGESRETVDGAVRLAASWHADELFTLFTSICTVPRYDPSVTAGVTARLAGPLTVGAAVGSEPDRFEYLAEIELAGFRFGYRGAYNPVLGSTQGCSMTWDGTLGRKDN